MGGKWSRNEAFNAGMHTNGEGFYCGNLDYETWENKLYSSWVNECARGMHPREEVCFTINQNEWRWMKFIHRLPLYKKIQDVHKQRYFGGLDQPSIRPLFTSDPTLMQSKKLVSYSTCWGSCTVFYIYIFFLMPVKSWHACFFPFCRDPWLTATPVRVWMRSSVQSDCPPLLCLISICLCKCQLIPGHFRTWRPQRLTIWIDCVSLS